MKFERSSGILLHITSLPSHYGIGDLGPAAFEFADFLKESAQRYWQILPLTPTLQPSGNSPYSSPSAFAGNILLISPDLLARDGYLKAGDLENPHSFNIEYVDFPTVIAFKKTLLEKAYQQFKKHLKTDENFVEFEKENSYWLHDYAVFTALWLHYGKEWSHWPKDIRDRNPQKLALAEEQLSETILREKFFQYIFFKQWKQLQEYCHQKGIQFIGDLPFYVSYNSADCWAHPEYFKLNKQKRPKMISGVPPDMFSKNGQLWGSPVYNWQSLSAHHFIWWVERLKHNLRLFDVVRLDHFRAFSAFWEVKSTHKTARQGHWSSTPGKELLSVLKGEFPHMPFIAEDLGEIDQPVYDLRDEFRLPGMNVLQYAFDNTLGQNQFLPHHHLRNSVVYTGTHDNNTTKGWYKNQKKATHKILENYTGRSVSENTIADTLQRLALMSPANLTIIPMQDILNLGEKAIMNRPGTLNNNWEWRLKPEKLSSRLSDHLRYLNELYARISSPL